jgi:hypothetical protein
VVVAAAGDRRRAAGARGSSQRALTRDALPGSRRHASIRVMKRAGWRIAALLLLSSCASGPHPALEVAAKDFECPIAQLERHEIYPNKQRVEGCDKEAVYVKDCGGYGTDAACRWAKAKPEY